MRYCPNFECPGRRLENLVHFTSRNAMDIRGLSYARITQLVDEGLIHDTADLYDLTPERLAQLDRLAEKSAQQLVDAIAESKKQPLSRLLFALGIANIGETAAKTLARHFGTMDNIMNASEEDVLAIHGIGEILARSVVDWFADPKARRLIDRLRERGLTFEEPQSQSGDALKGQTVVITGTLPSLSREEASNLVEANGGRVASSVSKKTSFVLVGSDAGSKLAKAQELGVRIVNEDEFKQLIGA
jgi:DNA ligase (NAD+)